MRFAIALALSLALVYLCAKPLKKHPVPFYVGAIALVGVYFWGIQANAHNELWGYFQPLMQRCALAFLLFSVVMFVGVLDEKSRLRTHLMPIRRQLSILACIFAVGHIVFYGSSYLMRLSGAFNANLVFSLSLAAVITVLMAVLGITSFQVVKHGMTAAVWKRIQKLAYPFYLLIYVHLLLLLAPQRRCRQQRCGAQRSRLFSGNRRLRCAAPPQGPGGSRRNRRPPLPRVGHRSGSSGSLRKIRILDR